MSSKPEQDPTVSDAKQFQTLNWGTTADRVRVWENERCQLCISVDDETFEDVRPRRVFPVSGRARFISFLGEKDKEMVLLTDPDELEPESKRALNYALERVYFMATITRVDEVGEAMGVSLWHVATNRGYATFEIVDRQRHIRILPEGRYILSDVDGNRFEIKDVRQLDPRSQTLIYSET